jgi:hypothetical protein
MWVDDFSPDLGLYASRCDYLKPGWLDMKQRIIDIGFLGNIFFFHTFLRLIYDIGTYTYCLSDF